MDDLLTIRQVSIIIKVHQLTVRRYINEGKLKAKRVGGNIRISSEDLRSFSENYMPNQRSSKSAKLNSTTSTPFSVNDPLMRLKGRGVSIEGEG